MYKEFKLLLQEKRRRKKDKKFSRINKELQWLMPKSTLKIPRICLLEILLYPAIDLSLIYPNLQLRDLLRSSRFVLHPRNLKQIYECFQVSNLNSLNIMMMLIVITARLHPSNPKWKGPNQLITKLFLTISSFRKIQGEKYSFQDRNLNHQLHQKGNTDKCQWMTE